MKTTITEALAELKTIAKRIQNKRQGVLTYLARDSKMKDPLEKSGGSAKFISEEIQAIGDLETRVVGIRTAIQEANLKTTLTLGGVEKSIAEWLTYRRELGENQRQFLTQMSMQLTAARENAKRQGRTVANVAAVVEANNDADLIVNVDESDLRKKIETHDATLGELDGKLSLLNATTQIEVA